MDSLPFVSRVHMRYTRLIRKVADECGTGLCPAVLWFSPILPRPGASRPACFPWGGGRASGAPSTVPSACANPCLSTPLKFMQNFCCSMPSYELTNLRSQRLTMPFASAVMLSKHQPAFEDYANRNGVAVHSSRGRKKLPPQTDASDAALSHTLPPVFDRQLDLLLARIEVYLTAQAKHSKSKLQTNTTKSHQTQILIR